MICINLIRVSADSKYLDINIEVTGECVLEKLSVAKLNTSNGDFERELDFTKYLRTEDKLDAEGNPIPELDEDGNPTFDDYGNPIFEQVISKKQVLRIDLKAFEGTGFFRVRMEENCTYEGWCGESIFAYASDVSSVYRYLIGKLMNMNCSCYKLDEDLERAFMFLYAHQEAMQLNRIDEAIKFYTALVKQFNLCGPAGRFGNDCICQTPQSRPFNIPKKTIPAGCGCRR